MRLLAHNMLACNAKVRAREETRGRPRGSGTPPEEKEDARTDSV